MTFWIRDIPSSMQQEGWTVAAQLLERWFSTAARTMTEGEKNGNVPPTSVPAAFVDRTSVTMDWVLSFARAREAHNYLLGRWSRSDQFGKSRDLIRKRLLKGVRSGLGANRERFRFGDFTATVPEIDVACQANFQAVSSSLVGGADGFYAAIANASIKLAVTGIVTRPDPTRLRLEIDEVGSYLRDTYDFIDGPDQWFSQRLGSWGPTGFLGAAFAAPEVSVTAATAASTNKGQAFWRATNASFNEYRRLHGRGGDFLIFSDLRRTRLPRPMVVEVSL